MSNSQIESMIRPNGQWRPLRFLVLFAPTDRCGNKEFKIPLSAAFTFCLCVDVRHLRFMFGAFRLHWARMQWRHAFLIFIFRWSALRKSDKSTGNATAVWSAEKVASAAAAETGATERNAVVPRSGRRSCGHKHTRARHSHSTIQRTILCRNPELISASETCRRHKRKLKTESFAHTAQWMAVSGNQMTIWILFFQT